MTRGFGLLWFGEGASLVGSMTTTLVLPLLAATELHAGAMAMGLLAAATWVPWLVGGLHVGALIDRTDPRRPMMVVDLLTAAALASVTVAHATGHLTLLHVLAAALMTGCSSLVIRTGMGALIPNLVEPAGLERANARIFGTEAAAQIAGPGLGGVLVTVVTAAGSLLVDVGSCLVSAVCLWRIPAAERPAGRLVGQGPAARRDPSGGGVLDGARLTWRDAYLRFFMVTGSLSNLGLSGYGSLLVLFMTGTLHLSAARIGLMEAIGAVGGLVGAAVAPALGARIGTARATILLGVLGGPAALVIPLAVPGARVWLLPAGTLLVGLGVVGANVLRSGFRQRWVPTELLGRVAGATGVVMMGSMALGGLVAGWLGSLVGLVPTMLAMAALHTLTALALLTPRCPFLRRRDFPQGPTPQL